MFDNDDVEDNEDDAVFPILIDAHNLALYLDNFFKNINSENHLNSIVNSEDNVSNEDVFDGDDRNIDDSG